MKKIILICFVLIAVKDLAQENPFKTKKEEDYNLFIAGGCHVGLWTLALEQVISFKELPYNIHIDKLCKKKYAFGLGYTYDNYPHSPIGNYDPNKNTHRQNIRVRFYKFLSDQEKSFSTYIGASLGVSYWDFGSIGFGSNNQYWPTAQFLFGIKVKLSEIFFWQTELGAGPPYALQTSLGIKF